MKYLFLLIVFISFKASCYDFFLRNDYGLTGSTVDKTDSDLQVQGGISNQSIEFQGSFFRNERLILGIGYGVLEKNYVLFLNGVGPSLDYQIKYSYLYTRIGYSFEFEKLSIVPSIVIGRGEYAFSGDNDVSIEDNAFNYGIELNFTAPISNSNFNYLLGLGYNHVTFSEIEEGDIDIGNSELNGELNFNIGLGYSF